MKPNEIKELRAKVRATKEPLAGAVVNEYEAELWDATVHKITRAEFLYFVDIVETGGHPALAVVQ